MAGGRPAHYWGAHICLFPTGPITQAPGQLSPAQPCGASGTCPTAVRVDPSACRPWSAPPLASGTPQLSSLDLTRPHTLSPSILVPHPQVACAHHPQGTPTPLITFLTMEPQGRLEETGGQPTSGWTSAHEDAPEGASSRDSEWGLASAGQGRSGLLGEVSSLGLSEGRLPRAQELQVPGDVLSD